MIVGDGDGRALFSVGGPTTLHVRVSPGQRPEDVRGRILTSLGSRHNFNVQVGSTVKQRLRANFQGFYVLFYAIFLVAAVVGALGLANTLAVSVISRVREIGILRSIGTLRTQVRAMVLWESFALGIVALVLSLPLGYLLSRLIVYRTSEAIGFSVSYRFPWVILPAVAAMAALIAMAAAGFPARRASRFEPAVALALD